MADPEILDAYIRGRSGATDITPSQYQQYYFILRANLTSHEDAFFQHQQKLLDETAFESTLAVLRRIYAFPGARAMWKRQRMSFEKSFRDFLDQVVNEVEVASPRFDADELASWHRDVAAELSKA